MPLLSFFPLQLLHKLTSKLIYVFTQCNSYYLKVKRITITCFWLNSNCLSCARSVVSSLSSSETCQLNSLRVIVSHLRLMKWETPTFVWWSLWRQHPDPNSVNYKICIENQHRVCLRNIHNVNGTLIAGMAYNASPITLQTSGVNVSGCVFMWKNDFLSIKFDCRFYICTF